MKEPTCATTPGPAGSRPVAGGRQRSRLVLPRAFASAIGDEAAAGHPLERCGLLVGRRERDTTHVVRLAPADNLAADRRERRYELDPAAFLSADQAARADGLAVVGFWHSHPDHPAVPSATDLDAAWEGYSYVIAAVTDRGAGELRSWRLTESRFVEETITEPRRASLPE